MSDDIKYTDKGIPSSELQDAEAAYAADSVHYTYTDYCSWEDGKRWELIDGIPIEMNSPSRVHQEISGELFFQLKSFLKGKPCEVYAAPFDVRLNADGADDTVVQPDLLVVCAHDKLDDKSCISAPDLIIEIQSPSTTRHDRITKLNLYRKYGVREYWMVEPDDKTVQVCILENGQYVITGYDDGDTVPVSVLPGLEISLPDVFAT